MRRSLKPRHTNPRRNRVAADVVPLSGLSANRNLAAPVNVWRSKFRFARNPGSTSRTRTSDPPSLSVWAANDAHMISSKRIAVAVISRPRCIAFPAAVRANRRAAPRRKSDPEGPLLVLDILVLDINVHKDFVKNTLRSAEPA